MATGSGKTYTAITSVYRLLKFADAKRILFLVDTRNLGQQTEQEFMPYLPNNDNRKFTKLYNVQLLKNSFIAGSSQVCISTIQRASSAKPLAQEVRRPRLLSSSRSGPALVRCATLMASCSAEVASSEIITSKRPRVEMCSSVYKQ